MSITTNDLAKMFQDLPTPKPVFYRAYYNDDGTLVCYTMEDLPGKYIEIDQPTYARGLVNVRVIDGKLIEVVPKQTVKKLQPADNGTACDPHNVSIVVDESKPHVKWSVRTNEIN